MGTPETSREPCPDRILDDVGGAFGMGAVGGSAFHFIKGLHNSPNGQRFLGAAQAARLNAPRIGGSFAVWGGLFSASDCMLIFARQKEDPWNSILSGATTGGILAMRQGLRASARSAAFGAGFLALIEGAGIAINKLSAQQPMLELMEEPPATTGVPSEDSAATAGTSWLGGWFGRGKKEDPRESAGSETKILESFDAPPVPNFKYQ